mgnify:CR=1 FL=1
MIEDYFSSNSFLTLLHEYEQCEKNGEPCIIGSDDYADLAEYYQAKGQEDKAKRAAKQGRKLYPGAIGPLVFSARYALCKEGNVQLATEYAEQIEDKYDLDYFYIMAEIQLAQGDVEAADSYLEEQMEQVSDDDLMDYIYDVAMLFTDYDHVDEAERWLNRYEEKDSADYLELYGRILFGKGQFDEGEKVINHLIDKNPYNSNYWNILATAHFQNGHIQEAIDSSEFSIAINPDDDEALLTKAHSLFVLGNYEDAMVFYERFNHLRKSAESHLQVAHCLMALERYDEGILHLQKAEEKAQNNQGLLIEIYQEIAFLQVYRGKLDEALAYIDKAELLDCDVNELLVVKGHLYLSTGHLAEAQQCFEQAIMQTDNHGKIFLRVAAAIYDNGHRLLAFKMLRLLKDVEIKDNLVGYSYFVLCFYFDQDRPYFLKYLKKVLECNPTEAKAMLADIFPSDLQPSEYYQFAVENMLNGKF